MIKNIFNSDFELLIRSVMLDKKRAELITAMAQSKGDVFINSLTKFDFDRILNEVVATSFYISATFSALGQTIDLAEKKLKDLKKVSNDVNVQ